MLARGGVTGFVVGAAIALLATGAHAQQSLGGWVSERFETYGDWILSCETAVGAPERRRCYLQNAKPYNPRPDFRSATIFVIADEAGGAPSVQLGLEPGAAVSATQIRFEPSTVAPDTPSDGLVFLPEPHTDFVLTATFEDCLWHLCDPPAEASAALLEQMADARNATLVWTMAPLGDARPDIEFDLADFRTAYAALSR